MLLTKGMTIAEFDRLQLDLECRLCLAVGDPERRDNGRDQEDRGVWCKSCGAHVHWLTKEKNKDKRPPIKASERDAAWSKYGDVCAHCNGPGWFFDAMRIARTAQHVPAYKDGGTNLIPYCQNCQDRSAAEMKRLETLISRLSEHLDLNKLRQRTAGLDALLARVDGED